MSEKERIMALLNANRGTKQGVRLSTKTMIAVGEGDMTVVLPPQAIMILGILIEDEGPWNEVELHELIQSHPEISEKQEPWRVLKYYSKRLTDSGWLVITK